jgi:polar amino acid transport system substrate-binding protein
MKKLILIYIVFLIISPPIGAETGTKIKIAVKEFPPFVFKDLKGFCIDMANSICKKNNLLPEFVYYKSVTDVLNAVESGECDINFSGITITAEREKRVDFSQPFFDSGLIVAVRAEPQSKVFIPYLPIFRAIGLSLIFFVIGLTLIAHLIWHFEKSDSDPKSFPTNYRRGILDAYWWAIVTMTTVGYGDKYPKRIKGRLIATCWMIIGIIWFAAFTATLSSSLTIERMEHGEIKGLADLNNKKVSVIKGTTSEEYLRYHEIVVVLADTLDDLIRNLKERKVDAVVYDAPALMYISKKDPSIKVVGNIFDEQRYGIVFPQIGNDFYKELFNVAILEMQTSGEYEKIYNKWF